MWGDTPLLGGEILYIGVVFFTQFKKNTFLEEKNSVFVFFIY